MFRIACRSSRKHLLQLAIPRLSERVGKSAGPSGGHVNNYSSLVPGEQRLAGQVAVITGGASGIGARTARLFTEHGARVVIADVQASQAEKLLEELGPQAEFVHCDVRKEEDIVKAWDQAYSLENRLDIVFNNAGILGALGPVSVLPIEEFDATMAVNLRAAVLGVKHAARLMIPAGKGSIVCTASAAGLRGGLFAFSYSTSKAAVIAMAKCAATELRRFGIRVNTVSPDLVGTPMGLDLVQSVTGGVPRKLGVEDTDFTAAAGEGTPGNLTFEILDKVIKHTSLIKGSSITDTDVANAVLYLASDTGGYITGQDLAIDGGRSNLNLVEPERNVWATTYEPMYNVGGQRGL